MKKQQIAARIALSTGVGVTHNGAAYVVEHSTQTLNTARNAERRAKRVFAQQSGAWPLHRGATT